ncbi:MAG TPA: TonB-dependent receptor [Longimicrobiaceae bacterium]|nr:TonB-dependent receptor [Longimicrobiaceae bacterium]
MKTPASRRRARSVLALSSVFLISWVGATAAAAQEVAALHLTVRAADTDAPLPGVQVVLQAAGISGVTDAQGALRLERVPPGAHSLVARRLGYATQTRVVHFTAGQTMVMVLDLDVEAIPLAEVRVSAKPRTSHTERYLTNVGFYGRRERNAGTFLTRYDIDRRHPYRLSDMLRAVPGVVLEPMAAGNDAYASMARSSVPGHRCPILYYVDGVPARGYNIDDMPARDVEALEIYRGPSQVPVEFDRAGAMCGLIVIWTRIEGET